MNDNFSPLLTTGFSYYQSITVLNTLEECKRYEVLDNRFIYDRIADFMYDMQSVIPNRAFTVHFMKEVYKHMKEGGMIDEEEET